MARRSRDDSRFEDMSSYSSSKEYKKRRKNRRGRTVMKSIGGVLCVLLILFGSGLIYGADLLSGLTTRSITKDKGELGISENIVMSEGIKNIALFGVDSRDDSFTGNSDAIMILSVDNTHHKLKMVSVLRDSKVPIEGKDKSGDYINIDFKINAAYSYGGPELAIRTLNTNFGLDDFNLGIEDYVTINFANMAAIVDAFGGVEVVIDDDEERLELNRILWDMFVEDNALKEQDEENGTTHKYMNITNQDPLPEDAIGKVKLNGRQAVAYGRIRDIDSDSVRAQRQQEILRGLISQIKGKSITEYAQMVRELAKYCETSFEPDDVISLAGILTGNFTIESTNVPEIEYEDPWGGKDPSLDYAWVWIYDVGQAARRISAFIDETDSPYWSDYGSTSSNKESSASSSSGSSGGE